MSAPDTASAFKQRAHALIDHKDLLGLDATGEQLRFRA